MVVHRDDARPLQDFADRIRLHADYVCDVEVADIDLVENRENSFILVHLLDAALEPAQLLSKGHVRVFFAAFRLD